MLNSKIPLPSSKPGKCNVEHAIVSAVLPALSVSFTQQQQQQQQQQKDFCNHI